MANLVPWGSRGGGHCIARDSQRSRGSSTEDGVNLSGDFEGPVAAAASLLGRWRERGPPGLRPPKLPDGENLRTKTS